MIKSFVEKIVTNLINPLRFSEPRKHLAAFFPFGLGQRTCVGKNMALVEANIILALIIQHYSFVLSPSYKHAPIMFCNFEASTWCTNHLQMDFMLMFVIVFNKEFMLMFDIIFFMDGHLRDIEFDWLPLL